MGSVYAQDLHLSSALFEMQKTKNPKTTTKQILSIISGILFCYNMNLNIYMLLSQFPFLSGFLLVCLQLNL